MRAAAEWQRALRWMQRRVVAHDDAMRIDRWLRHQFPAVPQSFFQRQLRQRKIRIVSSEGEAAVPAKPDTLLHAGAVVAIDAVIFDAALRNELTDSEPAAAPSLNLEMQAMVNRLVQRIVYKDDNYLVLNKPHGLAVQDGSALAHSLSTYLPAMGAVLESETPRLVHRLDKDTSGLLVLARHRLAAARFSEILRNGGVQKTYEALVRPLRHAAEIPSKGEVSLAIDNKPARTLYRRLRDDVQAERACWLEMQPVTGRKHQLRIHCALGLHAPIVGDLKYGPRQKDPREQLYLHAKRLLFVDPFRPRRSIDVVCEMDKLRTDVPPRSGAKSTKKRPTIKKP